MFRSSENLRLAAAMRALERVAAPWRQDRGRWFDGTPESIEARIAATDKVLTQARSGFTAAHLALTDEAETARRELMSAKHRLLIDFLDDGARAFKGSRRVADFDVEAGYYDDGADGLSEDQEGPRRFNMFPPGGDEINVGGYRYKHDPNTKQYLKVSPMGGLEGTPLEPGQEYSGGQSKPYYPDDWDGMSADQEGPRRFDMRGLVNEEHPYHADETGHLYGYDPVTQQHLKVSPMGGLEGTPEGPGQQYTEYLPPKADRTKGGRDRSARRTAVSWGGMEAPDDECLNCGQGIDFEQDPDLDVCPTCGQHPIHSDGAEFAWMQGRTGPGPNPYANPNHLGSHRVSGYPLGPGYDRPGFGTEDIAEYEDHLRQHDYHTEPTDRRGLERDLRYTEFDDDDPARYSRLAGAHDVDPDEPWRNTMADDPYRDMQPTPDFADLSLDGSYSGRHRLHENDHGMWEDQLMEGGGPGFPQNGPGKHRRTSAPQTSVGEGGAGISDIGPEMQTGTVATNLPGAVMKAVWNGSAMTGQESTPTFNPGPRVASIRDFDDHLLFDS
jgi:hypothetical protein